MSCKTGSLTSTSPRTRSLDENRANRGSSLISRRTSRQPIIDSSTGLTNSSMTRRNSSRLRRFNKATWLSNRRCFSVLSSSFVSRQRWSSCSILRVSCHDISGFRTFCPPPQHTQTGSSIKRLVQRMAKPYWLKSVKGVGC